MARSVLAIAAALAVAAPSVASAQNDATAYAWTQVTEAGGHYLLYGAGTDDISVSFRCSLTGARDARLLVYNAYTGDGAEPRRAEIFSGRTRQRLTGALNPRISVSAFQAQVPLGSPVLAAFARTGDLTADVGTYEVEAPAPAGPQRDAVARFFRLCRGGR